ncbi:MAG: hypothetical protein EX341_19200 [Candidatus Scalindua sp. SCAELEC01]|nr:hypothetical protein [Planctomycetota bacterium]RZV60626.1 MAG: hypothetical protein EX341_19200 [Candidatus Scalindua sp. SCAELEC01]
MVTDEKIESLNIEELDFHGEWNYKIKPHKRLQCTGYLFTHPIPIMDWEFRTSS